MALAKSRVLGIRGSRNIVSSAAVHRNQRSRISIEEKRMKKVFLLGQAGGDVFGGLN